MNKQVVFRDLGKDQPYKAVWDYQEELLQQNVKVKADAREAISNAEKQSGQLENIVTDNHSFSPTNNQPPTINFLPTNHQLQTTNLPPTNHQPSTTNLLATNDQPPPTNIPLPTTNLPQTVNYLLFVEHSPVYTLGKSGQISHVLISEEERQKKGIEFFRINRGGDITFHGPQQLVGYPIFDLENFKTDLGWYLRSLEEVIILTMAEYGLTGDRSKGETGVWMDPGIKGKERKICAFGIRCSRWITMHGFALNVNTNLDYFNYIIPCGIQHKQVTSLQKELGFEVPFEAVKEKVKKNFEVVFGVEMI